MKSFKRLIKPLLATAAIGGGGYYLYDSIKTKNLVQIQTEPIVDPQNLSTSIPSLLYHQKHQHHTPHEQENLNIQKQESRKTSLFQKTVQNQPQERKKQQNPSQNTKTSQPQTKTLTQEVPLSPEKVNEAVPTPEKTEQKPIEAKGPIDISKIKRLSQLNELPMLPKEQLKTVIVVSDMGYTQQFEQKLLETIRSIKKVPNSESIEVYRANTTKPQFLQEISKAYGHKMKEETIFLLKNELDDNFIDISFDMYMQYPTLISTYLTKLNLYNQSNQAQYLKRLEKMSPNESYLMFVYDDSQPPEKRTKALLAAKYIQMELALQNLDQAIKVIPVEATVVRNNKLIPEDKIRSKSIHIIRKHNEFTHVPPNFYLKFIDQIIPYNLLPDIGLHNKRGQVAIQQYLHKIQTFNSLSITTPYLLSLTIDKNRISTENYKKLMDTFKQIKRKNKFPQISIALKFAEVGYLGKNQAENSEFCIKIANVAELQNQSAIHEITNLQDAKNMGITQQNWLKNSYEFLYPHQAVSEQLIQGFVEKVLTGEVPQYYRSDKPSSIQNVHKIVASNFYQQVLQNNLDHFVFEYSDHCPSCKLISPLIAYMNDILTPIPIDQSNCQFIIKGFDIHVMNCHKNRVKGQVYSPYTPNMNYFKSEWKHAGPVRIGLETIKYGGLEGLYTFCIITNMLKTIDSKKFGEAIESAKGWDKAEFVL